LKYRAPFKVAAIAVLMILAGGIGGLASAAEYDSMASYEDLLRSQTVLIGSFENLLKNTTLNDSMSYQFLDSFDDLAARQQRGLYSFEDVVSFNWTDLDTQQRINLTSSFEDLIRREAIILESNEDLLKRSFCILQNPDQKKDLLDRFEARLKYEVVLYEKFEDWLHFQQMIETEGEYQTWMEFLASFEDLIRRQAYLLDSFETLMKIRCDTTYLGLTKEITGQVGNTVTYRYIVTSGTNDVQDITINDSILGDIGQVDYLAAGASQTFTETATLQCADCDNCRCHVCNFAVACGEVVTTNGNFTVCVVSDQVCPIIVDGNTAEDIYPGIEVPEEVVSEETASQSADAEAEAETAAQESVAQEESAPAPCPSCSKK